MFKSLFTSVALAGAAIATESYDVSFESLGRFDVKNPAFVDVTEFEVDGVSSDKFLIVSEFGALSSGKVSIVPSVQQASDEGNVSSLTATKLDTPSFEWPNDVKVIPGDVFGERAIVVPDGFLVPGKSNGNIYAIRMDENDVTVATETVKLSSFPNGYFAHMGFWVDLNGDGRKDFLTARSNAKAGHGQLLWLEHPEGGLDVAPWEEHIITQGPDVGFTIDFDMFPGYLTVFAAQFFDETLAWYQISLEDGSLYDSMIIDDT